MVDDVQPRHAGKSLAAACSLQATASVTTLARSILRSSAAARRDKKTHMTAGVDGRPA